MKKFFYTLLAVIIALFIINAKTDWFYNFGDYLPQLEESNPEIVSSVEEISETILKLTERIPTPSELLAILRQEELPIDPADVAVNAYIENSPMLTFYPEENISAKIKDGEYIRLFGISSDKSKKNFIVRFSDADNDELDQFSMSVNSDGEFDKTIKIPESDRKYMSVEVYTGSRAYGEFTSWVYNYLYLSRDENGVWSIKQSPVYANNKELYTADKAISDALKDTPAIESDEEKIIDLARKITVDAVSDYEKLRLIHDWVCENLRYDTDRLNSSSTVPYAAVKVLESRRAVCLGFSTLTAALCRSVGIPCNVVSGYALGVGSDTEWTTETINTSEQNHAWNEAYVDGRWVILDTTWDCHNKIENGETVTEGLSHIYFDANIDFFSANHKIIEYMKRP